MSDVVSQADVEQLVAGISAGNDDVKTETENFIRTDSDNVEEYNNNKIECKITFSKGDNNLNINDINKIFELISPAVEKLVNHLASCTNKKLEKPFTFFDYNSVESIFDKLLPSYYNKGPFNYLRVIYVNDSPIFLLCDAKIMNYIILDESSFDCEKYNFTNEQQCLADEFIYKPLVQYLCELNLDVKISSSDKIFDYNYLKKLSKGDDLAKAVIEVSEDNSSLESGVLTFIAHEKSWFYLLGENYPPKSYTLSLLNDDFCENYNSFAIFAETNLNDNAVNKLKVGDFLYTDVLDYNGYGESISLALDEKTKKDLLDNHNICNENREKLLFGSQYISDGNLCIDSDYNFFFYVRNMIAENDRRDYFYHNKNNLFIINGFAKINEKKIAAKDILNLRTSLTDDFCIVYKNKIIALCKVYDFRKNKFKITAVLDKPVAIIK